MIKVSIITVTYNCESLIEKTIESVVNQTYSYIEYIIIDGMSQDNTMNRINQYRDKIDVIISEKDRGISDAFNKGIKNATGELIMFLNAGDCLIEDTIIDKVVSDWDDCKKDILFYKVLVGNQTFIPAESFDDCEIDIWNACQLPHQGTFVHKRVFENVGGFNTCIRIRMDYDFFARCKCFGCTYKYISEVIVRYESGGTSMMTNNAKQFYKEGFAIQLLYGLHVNIIDLLFYLTPKWLRKISKKIVKR